MSTQGTKEQVTEGVVAIKSFITKYTIDCGQKCTTMSKVQAAAVIILHHSFLVDRGHLQITMYKYRIIIKLLYDVVATVSFVATATTAFQVMDLFASDDPLACCFPQLLSLCAASSCLLLPRLGLSSLVWLCLALPCLADPFLFDPKLTLFMLTGILHES